MWEPEGELDDPRGAFWSGVFFFLCDFLFSCCSHCSAAFRPHQPCRLRICLTQAGNEGFLMNNRKRTELGQRSNPCRKALVALPPHLSVSKGRQEKVIFSDRIHSNYKVGQSSQYTRTPDIPTCNT